MANPSTVFSEIVTTTLRATNRKIADNISNSNAFLQRLKKRHGEILEGGYEIQEPLSYTENSTYQRFSGYDILDISPSDSISSAKFDWKNQVIHVSSDNETLRKNSGKEAMIKLAKARTDIAIDTFKNELSRDMYSDGTLTNQINGLQALIADAGTGTVGGINSSTYTFWQNKVQSAASPLQGGGAITPSASTIESLMQALYIRLERGTERPDMIIADYNYFTFYELSQTPLRRYTKEAEQGDAGFLSLKYKNADVFHDGDSGIPTNHMYFLNTKYIKMVTHSAANMDIQPAMRAINQDATVIPIINMCQLVVSNRSRQGVLKA